MTSIYGLIDEFGNIRYIGKTITSLNRRLVNHIYKAKSNRCKTICGDWIRELLNKNLKPGIVLLQQTKASWKRAEKYWIKKLRSEGYSLLNILDGGNGSHKRIKLSKNIINKFGKISDSELAKIVKCSRENISYHRRNLGIEAMPQNRSHNFDHRKGKIPWNKINFPDHIIQLLGTVPDRVLAKKINVSVASINKLRNSLNIKSYLER